MNFLPFSMFLLNASTRANLAQYKTKKLAKSMTLLVDGSFSPYGTAGKQRQLFLFMQSCYNFYASIICHKLSFLIPLI